MKRITAILVLLVFLFSTTGYQIVEHYCAGELKQTALFFDNDCHEEAAPISCCKKEEKIVQKACCKSKPSNQEQKKNEEENHTCFKSETCCSHKYHFQKGNNYEAITFKPKADLKPVLLNLFEKFSYKDGPKFCNNLELSSESFRPKEKNIQTLHCVLII